VSDQNTAESTQNVSDPSLNSAPAVTEPPEVLTTQSEEKPEVKDVAVKEKEPEERHLKSVKEEKSEKKTESSKTEAEVDWLGKIEKLQGEVSDARALMDEMKSQENQRQEKARVALVEGEWGLLDRDYMKIPSFPSGADATTNEGKEELRQWMVKHPGLFKGAPSIPTSVKEDAAEQIKVQGQKWRWSDIFKG
jgi:hypothetical protein